MMLKKIPYIFLMILFILIPTQREAVSAEASGNSTFAQQLLSKADRSRRSLLESASRMKYRDKWFECISKYKDIYEKYPKSDQAAWAIYQSAGLYRKLYKYSYLEEDLDNALALYEKLIEGYKDHRLADDAQYYRGEIYYREKNNPTQAFVELLKLDNNFPSGDMRSKGKAMMNEVSVALGKEEEITASNELVAVRNIRHWSTSTYTRVVIDTDMAVKYSYNLLKEDKTIDKPRRLYIDLENSRVGSDIVSSIPIKDGLLREARAAQYDKDTVRVVLDIDNIEDYKIFSLYDPFRVVIDVQGSGSQAKQTEKKGVASNTAGSAASTRAARKGIFKPGGADETVSLAGQLGLSVKTIVIDPGHGGKDPGCDINGDVKEKDVTLDLARKLKAKIEKEIEGCKVLLTRDKDIFVPLDERTAFANVNKADLFISLHVNAHKQESVYGIETYFLNMATDERAVMVAARENATSEKRISDLQSILNDLMLNTKISESSKLAYKVQDGMMANIKKTYRMRKDLGVKQAPFYVLIGAEMPAVLIEIGFSTNPYEKKRLLNIDYRALIADGIIDGINTYIKSIELAGSGNIGG
ncbi:MAG: N-acetylmuramoyl-L-alanine amidase [Deltaproteobacteria bacterium]|nr:N-acetylmuramoyl-L-alanine amidase [Deltaproteobacteria bacterium]